MLYSNTSMQMSEKVSLDTHILLLVTAWRPTEESSSHLKL
jgi:hypothetical protein